MLIGIALAEIRKIRINWKFVGITFFLKFLVRPLLTLLIIFIDRSFFHYYDPLIYNILFIVSLVPLSVNSIAIASIFELRTDDIAVAILLSTLFAFLFIPLAIALIGVF